jgi:hypothetical protein
MVSTHYLFKFRNSTVSLAHSIKTFLVENIKPTNDLIAVNITILISHLNNINSKFKKGIQLITWLAAGIVHL